ncbi:thioesterase family protein [Caldinitratiruptor microaerophilus]|uniref:Thioesterase n=1 Tax=Caldinitratiruptor microaerophilus TaxID=671077 RepID=A0AA35G9D1_9FIRM|nr:thioesterase family protein [Caldinitratiruptor microaerophilus]BDG60169.1 thioesterase [Caldinitratiruptor microaerophilus]
MTTPALTPGLTGELRLRVGPEHTAEAIGSGGVRVFSTPHMIGLMEGAAATAVQPHLAPGETTVGILVDVRHLAATPVGMEVVARAVLEEVDGRRLVFRVEAHDETEKIGEGRHERFIVQLDRFLNRVEQKKAP